MKRTMTFILCFVVAGGFVFSAGGSEGETASSGVAQNLDPWEPYAETVSLTIGRETEVSSSNLPPGHTMEDNLYLQHIRNKLNVDVSYSWLVEASTYDQKVNLVIASGDIPDVMEIRNQQQLNQLVEAGMIADLTQSFERTLSPYLKGIFDSYGDRQTDTAEFDGKVMAIPSLNIGYQFALLWIRKDWMEQIGAEPPTTLEGIYDLAKRFIQEDPGGNGPGGTIGITANPKVAGVYNSIHSLDPVFGRFDAFPRQWIPDGSGNWVYGTTTESTKAALASLAEAYADGLIDPEFAVHKGDDENALLASEKSGIFFGPWWMPYFPLNDALNNNRAAEWWPYMAPLDENGKYNVYYQNPHSRWMVVKKGYANPEALVKVLNLEYAGIRMFDEEAAKFYEGMNVNWGVWPIPILLGYDDGILRIWDEMEMALESGDPSHLDTEQRGYYDSMVRYHEDPMGSDVVDWSHTLAREMGLRVTASTENLTFAGNKFPGQTPTMELKWANLVKLEDEAMLKIIMGVEPVDYFDTFVSEWMRLGGEEITREVNDILK